MHTSPVIDGKINEEEWRYAYAVTAFRGGSIVNKYAYSESLRMIWYLGYDDKNLYLAMNAVFPKTISLMANGEKNFRR